MATKPQNDGHLGRVFEAELRAAIEHRYPGLADGRCKIPDARRATDAREKRIADIIIPGPKGHTIYLEAKATSKPRWELRNLKDEQRKSLRHLRDMEHISWVIVLFRVPPPKTMQRCVAVAAHSMLALCEAQQHGEFGASATPDDLLNGPWATRDGWDAREVPMTAWGWGVNLLYRYDIAG